MPSTNAIIANTTFDQVAMGEMVTCAVSMESKLFCFGHNLFMTDGVPIDLEVA